MVLELALMLLGAGFAVALALEWLAWRASLRLQVLAHPNLRSFHDRPTPTGGGVAFVVPLVAYLGWLGAQGAAPAAALAGGGALLAVVGLWDDWRELSARVRLVAQAAAAAAVAWAVLPEAAASGGVGAAWLVLVTFLLVWQVNLYNFMDGIDGLAGAQALVLFAGAQVVGLGLPGWPGDLAWLACGAVLGFLVFNWPPARIFMGDVGSGFLGLVTGGFALVAWQQGGLPLTASLILLAGFWFDATYTLIVRILTGQAFTQAHRSHLYQKLAAKRGHLWTTVTFLLYAAAWLVPLAWLCARQPAADSLWSPLWLAAAVAPLALAAWRLGAGQPEPAREPHDQ
jgi:Fuc2NAc and GlcNAc transferase